MRKILKRWLLVFMTVVLVTGYNCNVFAHESENAMVGRENTQEIIEIGEEFEVNETIAEARVELQEFETELDNKSVFVSVDEKIENQPEMFSGYSVGKIRSVSDLEQLPMVCDEVYENTNPNYAYGVAANTEYTGSITTEGEIRWYAFDITEQTKVSILIRSVETLDADIFLFKLDTSTM